LYLDIFSKKVETTRATTFVKTRLANASNAKNAENARRKRTRKARRDQANKFKRVEGCVRYKTMRQVASDIEDGLCGCTKEDVTLREFEIPSRKPLPLGNY
jgi:hypothetical protein